MQEIDDLSGPGVAVDSISTRPAGTGREIGTDGAIGVGQPGWAGDGAARGSAAPPRWVAVDVLRGMLIVMVVGGSELVAASLALIGTRGWPAAIGRNISEHVAWEGLHVHDALFPILVFVSGISVPLVVTAPIERGVPRGRVLGRCARRVALLFLVGLVYNGALALPPFEEVRILGVLQRYALAWGGAALVVAMSPRRRVQVGVVVALLVGYWLVLRSGASLGFPAGDLTPSGNLAGWIDRSMLAPGQLFDSWGDPEGILSTFPAIASALCGAILGSWLRQHLRERQGRAVLSGRDLSTMVGAGVGLLAAGYAWGGWFPIIKQIWTSSFVLVTVGWGVLALAALIAVMGSTPARALAAVFEPFGRNALLIYVGVSIVDFVSIADFFLGGITARVDAAGRVDVSVVIILTGALTVQWLVLRLLARHRLYVRA